MSSRATRKSASADKSTATQSASAQPVATLTGPAERRTEICRTVSEAMTALSKRKSMDWTRESPEITAAEAELDNAMADYVAGTATREQVKKAYKGWADLHIVEKETE